MGQVIPFKRRPLSERTRGNTLCRNGHHKWERCDKQQFDVKLGKLVTRYRCRRCGAIRNRAE